MIKVVVVTKEEKILKLTISGHALSNEHGKDLVCAGVSGILFGLSNLDEPDKMNIVVEENSVFIDSVDKATKHDYTVIETIMTSLQVINHNYQKYIKISQERK